MNRPPEEVALRVLPEPLRQFSEACLKAAGMRTEGARLLAELLTNSDLRGVRSHGNLAMPRYARSFDDGQTNPKPDVRIIKETESSVLIDGDGGLGYTPMMRATEMACDRALERGVAVGATCHHGHYGSAGHYVRRAMDRGCTAFSVQGTHPGHFGEGGGNPGKQSAYWGNPPICLGLPGEQGPPLILDAATCVLADYQRGEEFDALQKMIPAAFFKSMGYTGVATALGGCFVGVNNDRARAVTERWPRAKSGGLIIVMSLGLFTDPGEVRSGIDELVEGVRREMEPMYGYPEATTPGTVEYHKEKEYLREGIPLSTADARYLEEAGDEFGVAAPWGE
ncbi:MAG: Ldh family oxidoreductase [Candidatus Latescibacterota bacterium]|nr:Ldh family oxidoreductase [Candidatus Latescibacterota bacterium]